MNIDLLWTPEPRLTPKSNTVRDEPNRNAECGSRWAIMCRYAGGVFFFRNDEAIEWLEEHGYPPQTVSSCLSDLCNLKYIEKRGGGLYRFLREAHEVILCEELLALGQVRRAERAKALKERARAGD